MVQTFLHGHTYMWHYFKPSPWMYLSSPLCFLNQTRYMLIYKHKYYNCVDQMCFFSVYKIYKTRRISLFAGACFRGR